MKLIVKELEKQTSIEEILNLDALIDDASDLIGLKDVKVSGTIERSYDEVVLDLTVDLNVVQKCARTLKPVTYPLVFDTEIIFSKDEKTYDYLLTNVIDLDELIFAEILLEKEPFVYDEDAVDPIDESKGQGHPAFQSLKDTK